MPKTVLYAASAAILADSSLYEAARGAVSDERRSRTDRYRFAQDRYLSLSAELLLQYGLREAGWEGKTLEFTYGAHGKPYLKDAGVYFSLAHSGEYALCAISEYEVGCDIERIAPARLSVAKRFFCPQEYEDLMVQPAEKQRDELFCRYWTLKESFLKATGMGLALPLNAFCIVPGTDVTVIQSADERSYRFAEFADLPGYRCALCTAGDCRDAELRIVDLAEILDGQKSRPIR